jgi:hypothetical protein
MGRLFLTTVLTTIKTVKMNKTNKMNRKFDKQKPCNRCDCRVSGVEVAGFEPAAFWSRT